MTRSAARTSSVDRLPRQLGRTRVVGHGIEGVEVVLGDHRVESVRTSRCSSR